MCKPLLPILKDQLAHSFWKAHHIASVHHHHGDHHADQEIATATHEDENNKFPSTSKLAEPVSVHLLEQSDYRLLPPSKAENKFGVTIYKISTLLVTKHYPPPKAC